MVGITQWGDTHPLLGRPFGGKAMPVHTVRERAKKNVKRGPKGRIVRTRKNEGVVVIPVKKTRAKRKK